MPEFTSMKLSELTTAYNEMVLTAVDLAVKGYKPRKQFKDRTSGVKRCEELHAELQKVNGANKGKQPPKRKSVIDGAGKISLLVEENPKRGKSKAHEHFAFYKNGMLVSTFIEKMGDRALAMATLRWDVKKKYIEIST